MKILIINGPNLNMLGKRNHNYYGNLNLNEINKLIKKTFPNIKFKFFQSNSEEKIINKIQKADKYNALLINPAAYTHTSLAIRDALEILNIPKVSVHLSDIYNREDFRKVDLIKDVCLKVFYGKKHNSYIEAIKYIIDL